MLTGVDEHGAQLHLATDGLQARCLQHEVDHLRGCLYLDRLPPDQRRALQF